MTDEPWRPTPDGIVVTCRLTPKGGRDAIDGVARLSDGTSVLLARVRAAPEDVRANEALRALLATKPGAPFSRARSYLRSLDRQGFPSQALLGRKLPQGGSPGGGARSAGWAVARRF